MNQLEGDINGFGYRPKDIDSWKEETNKALKTRAEPYRVVSSNGYMFFQFFTILFFMSLVVIGIFFLYLVNEGKLQDVNEQPINVDNQYNSTTNNQYANDFKTDNTFYNNFTLRLDTEVINRLCNQS